MILFESTITQQWRQFSLRFMMTVLSVVAIGLAIWLQRPSPDLVIDLATGGSMQIEGRLVEQETLGDHLKSESDYRKIWLTDCQLQIRADADTKTSELQNVIELAQSVGIEEISIAINQ